MVHSSSKPCLMTPECKSHKIPSNHHCPMVFLWFSYGFPMVFLVQSLQVGRLDPGVQPWPGAVQDQQQGQWCGQRCLRLGRQPHIPRAWEFLCACAYLSIDLWMYLSIFPSFYGSFFLSFFLSFFPSIYLSIYLSYPILSYLL